MKRLSRLLLGPGALPDVPTSPHELVLEVIRLHDELQLPRAIREHNAKILAYNIAAGETRDVPEGSRQTAREMIARWLLGDDSGTGAA
ncbi:MAG TPA: hypothetical protein VHE30_25970 [Polyangiaceae bacterium]|nr:hypothetical protein [Polyangiaceae bacterium]